MLVFRKRPWGECNSTLAWGSEEISPPSQEEMLPKEHGWAYIIYVRQCESNKIKLKLKYKHTSWLICVRKEGNAPAVEFAVLQRDQEVETRERERDFAA